MSDGQKQFEDLFIHDSGQEPELDEELEPDFDGRRPLVPEKKKPAIDLKSRAMSLMRFIIFAGLDLFLIWLALTWFYPEGLEIIKEFILKASVSSLSPS